MQRLQWSNKNRIRANKKEAGPICEIVSLSKINSTINYQWQFKVDSSGLYNPSIPQRKQEGSIYMSNSDFMALMLDCLGGAKPLTIAQVNFN